jgi:predicted dehydrogenase
LKFLVAGAGSIGLRHARNLRLLGAGEIAFADPNERCRDSAAAEFGSPVFSCLTDGLTWLPDLVVIASPTHLHLKQAMEAAEAGCHLFIEKPLGASLESAAELAQLVLEHGLVTLVGCNMRFHPGPATVKNLLENQVIGRPLFARIHTGSYLPGWRPGSDYRQSYSANQAMGGGCILDCIHEIDLARWYLGDVSEVSCLAAHISALEIDTEDYAMLICRHRKGPISEIHLDYVQRTYERGCQIVGERGSIWWDYRSASVRWFGVDAGGWQEIPQAPGWQVNDMYVAELRHLLRCLEGSEQPALSVAAALDVMRIAVAAKTAAARGCVVPTDALENTYGSGNYTSTHELEPTAR